MLGARCTLYRALLIRHLIRLDIRIRNLKEPYKLHLKVGAPRDGGLWFGKLLTDAFGFWIGTLDLVIKM